MKAVILVGGYGTRLKPLTNDVPKPLVPFLGRPMVEWQIEALTKAGVADIILAIGYKEDLMRDFVENMRQKYAVRIHCSVESKALGTAGPLKLAEKLICADETGPDFFLLLSSDIICDYPIDEMVQFHNTHRGMVSLVVAEQEDTRRFGVVRFDAKSRLVESFVEKPLDFQGKSINAGIYVINKKVIDLIELREMSLEREIFPRLVAQQQMYAWQLCGFWRDIGLPLDFIACTRLLLEHLHGQGKRFVDEFELLGSGPGRVGLNLVHPTADIGQGSIGPFCVIHAGVSLGKESVIARSILMDNVHVDENCVVEDAIVQNRTQIGAHSNVRDVCMFATASVVPPGSLIHNASFSSSSSL